VPEGSEYCEVHEVHDCLSYIRAYAAHFELNAGRWNKAAQLAAGLIDRHSLAIAQRLPALVVLGLVRARRGDPGVEQLFDEALRLALPTGELQRIGRVAAACAEVAWYSGDVSTRRRAGANWIAGAWWWERSLDSRELAFWGRRADPTLEVASPIAEPMP